MSDVKPLRALVWCAVSTKVQADEERFSLPAQEADALALCEQESWQVVEVLKVPGHSRSYRSLEKLAEDARTKGIDAFDRLIYHLDQGDFDVLVCKDADRFARKASLMHMIVETVIEDCAARIYSFADGWVDDANADIFAMVKGYTTSKEIKKLVKNRHFGMKKRAERGLRTGTHAPFPYKVTRDEYDREIGLEPDRSQQHVVDDATTLLLSGVPWGKMEIELFERFGHGKDNRPFRQHLLRHMFYRPTFHGHTAWGLVSKARFNNIHRGTWMFDPEEQPPKDVFRFLNTHEPYYSGETADLIQAELRRRRALTGKNSPRGTRPFASLIICGTCTYHIAYFTNKKYFEGYRCLSRYRRTYDLGYRCTNTGSINTKTVQAWLDPILRQLVDTGDLSVLFGEVESSDETDETYLAALRADVAALDARAREMVRRHVPAALQSIYEDELTAMSEALAIKQAALTEAERRYKQHTGNSSIQRTALSRLTDLGVDAFWQQEGMVINQTLMALFGDYRMVMQDKQIIRISMKPPRFRGRD